MKNKISIAAFCVIIVISLFICFIFTGVFSDPILSILFLLLMICINLLVATLLYNSKYKKNFSILICTVGTLTTILIITLSSVHIDALKLVKEKLQDCDSQEVEICLLSDGAINKLKSYVKFMDTGRVGYYIDEIVDKKNSKSIIFKCNDYISMINNKDLKIKKYSDFTELDSFMTKKNKNISCLVSENIEKTEYYLSFYIQKEQNDSKRYLFANNSKVPIEDYKYIEAKNNDILVFVFKLDEKEDKRYFDGEKFVKYKNDGLFSVGNNLKLYEVFPDGKLVLNIGFNKQNIIFDINLLEIHYKALRLILSLIFALIAFIVIQYNNLKVIVKDIPKIKL